MMDGRVGDVTPLVGGSLKPQCGLECVKLGAVIDFNTV
jgi:hypothetical protein